MSLPRRAVEVVDTCKEHILKLPQLEWKNASKISSIEYKGELIFTNNILINNKLILIINTKPNINSNYRILRWLKNNCWKFF